MPRDPRTERGLAVARRMQQVGVAPASQRLDRGMRELAWLGSRLTDADLLAVADADARGGLAALRDVLAGAGLSDAGFAALEAQYQRGGLQAVSVAVQAQMRHEAVATTQQETVAALAALTPEQWAAVPRVLAAGGPDRLAQEAEALGLPREVARMVAHTVAAVGVEQTRNAVAERVQAQTWAENLHAAAQRDFEAAQKERGPFAAEDIHVAALRFYSAHGAELEAAGVGRKDGESPVGWMKRIARSGDEAIRKVAEATKSTPQQIHTIADRSRVYEDHAVLSAQVRGSDESARKARARTPQYPVDPTPTKPRRDGLEEAAAKAAQAIGFHEDGARRQRPSGDSAVDRAMSQALDHLEGPDLSADESSTRDAMEAADYQPNGSNHDRPTE
jgi:hypothetical protein